MERGVFILSSEKKQNVYGLGINVFIALAVLTIIEYFVSVSSFNSTTLLFIIAFIKAAAIVNWFMHIYRLWRPDEEGH